MHDYQGVGLDTPNIVVSDPWQLTRNEQAVLRAARPAAGGARSRKFLLPKGARAAVDGAFGSKGACGASHHWGAVVARPGARGLLFFLG